MRVSMRELQVAWRSVRQGSPAAGPDGETVADFALAADEALPALLDALRRDRWRHGPYHAFAVPKPDGGSRTLCLANVSDRLVQRVLLERLTPALEAHSLPCSYAYRPGRGHLDAVREVAEVHERGFTQVLRTDVADCFDSICLEVLTPALAEICPDLSLVQLILEAVAAPRRGLPPGTASVGLPQGSILAPALCNLVLTHLDRVLEGKHLRVIRYADDLAILAAAERTLARAEERARYALWELGLRLNERKTQRTDFTQGFQYLGARFVGRLVLVNTRQPYPRRPPGPRRGSGPGGRRGRDGLGYFV